MIRRSIKKQGTTYESLAAMITMLAVATSAADAKGPGGAPGGGGASSSSPGQSFRNMVPSQALTEHPVMRRANRCEPMAL
jgi:hypothetical protein